MYSFQVIAIWLKCLFYCFSFGSTVRNEHHPGPYVGEGIISLLLLFLLHLSLSLWATLQRLHAILSWVHWPGDAEDRLSPERRMPNMIDVLSISEPSLPRPPLSDKHQRCSWHAELKFCSLLTELSLHLQLVKWGKINKVHVEAWKNN